MTDELIARIVLFLVMASMGVMLLWLASAAASGRLGRNALAGIRTPSTMTSDAAWLAAHQRAEGPTRAAGIASVVAALPAVVPVPMPVVIGSVLAGSAVVLVLMIHGAVVGGRAAREADARPSHER